MVRAVEQAAFGQVLGRHRPALLRRKGRQFVLHAGLALADQHHVARLACGLQHVDGQVGDRLGHRIDRIDRIGF